ncbi:glycosyl transferase [Bacteroidia bacterium]|nr:glycosyl transferase [Bacteroidia bacterium]
MKKAAIVILNWNGRKLLEKFLPSLLERTPAGEADIIVADNGSSDDSLLFLETHYPDIQRIPLDKNYGFAEGYNRALTDLRHEWIILLNSDVEVSENWFHRAMDYLDEHKNIIGLQPKILAYNNPAFFEYAGACGGYVDGYGYPFCRGRVLDTIEADNGQYDEPKPVFWASGACLFIRLTEFKAAGGFDAQFFAHQEEIDLCWRLNARGKKLVVLPQSVVFHVGGATLGKENPQKIYLNFRNNLLMIYKNLPDCYYRKVMIARFFLDYLSALHFLLKGNFENALAIGKARRDFKRLKTNYIAVRKENLKLTLNDELPDTILRKSMIMQYYIQKKKRFSQLFTTI